MLKTSRPRRVFTTLMTITLLACDKATPFDGPTPFDGGTPIVTGTIRSRASVEGVAGMLVYEDGATESDCFPHRARFTFGPDAVVFRNGVRKSVSDLQTGQRVSVYGDWPTIKPCMPTAIAHGVLVY